MDVCSLPLSLFVYTTKVHKVFRDEEALLVLSVLVVVLVISLALEKISRAVSHPFIHLYVHRECRKEWPASEPQSVSLVSPDGELLVQRERQVTRSKRQVVQRVGSD